MRRLILAMWALLGTVPAANAAETAPSCAAAQSCPLIGPATPADRAQCLKWQTELERPARFVSGGQIQLDRFEKLVGDWMGGYCYRLISDGRYDWPHDATARDTGPFVSTFANGKFSGKSLSSHVVARVWYSPAMRDWMAVNRPANEEDAPADPPAIPEGAIMVKEMWPAPASLYRGECFDCKAPGSSGAVIFIRDSKSFSTGWFTGWYGKGAVIDWPAGKANGLTSMGDGGQGFCLNCHGSTTPGSTFASMNNIDGHPATFVTQLPPMSTQAPMGMGVAQKSASSAGSSPDGQDADREHHRSLAIPLTELIPVDEALAVADAGFVDTFAWPVQNKSKSKSDLPVPANMPSQTYDSVLIPGTGPVDHFLTSTQCVGCHQANATGLQLDMLDFTPGPLGAGGEGKPVSLSPYSMWSSSPMGLAGRDPIFYSQLESEQIIHADWNRRADGKQKAAVRALIQDTCLQCHGNMGQRQKAIDSHAETGSCAQFSRAEANIVPFPYTDQNWPHQAQAASYAGLARDGISCSTCHQLALFEEADKFADAPWNTCIKQKQKSLNPTFTGFAATFSGSFPLGSPDTLNGPFPDPLTKPMANSLRVIPEHNEAIRSSEVCGSCHSIHLPVLDRPQPEDRCLPQTDPADPFRCFPKRYEQTTYPEWVFSAFRTGWLGDQLLPSGPGDTPLSCQQCHMPSTDSAGNALASKIASIEEYSNYPQTDYRLPAAEIDLPVRSPYAQHQLVGLNVFLTEMAQQKPEILGIRSQDPGLVGMNVAPLQVTENAMVEQARKHTAQLVVVPEWDEANGTLRARVSVSNLTGHKFPSGVSFRRAFIEFRVHDAKGSVIWASGRSNDQGVIVDQNQQAVAGEFWWDQTCRARLPNAWQPHFETINAENQAQIYQELITDAAGQLTTSFLSINAHPKDNRLQPRGFLPEPERIAIAAALGDRTPLHSHGDGPFPMDENLGVAVGPEGEAASDPDYQNGSGIDRLDYVVSGLGAKPAYVTAQLHYQSIPPFYQQDRYCTAANADPKGTPTTDTERLHYLAAHLDLKGTAAEGWKLVVGAQARADVR
ncbi:MAG: hypothetical protein KDI66_11025 [Xanthomonadales bacterium]|nr:hypothetical protein [Xanthomonadales bacterium]